jgi:ribonucleoside-diphosphate reductase alpha chain
MVKRMLLPGKFSWKGTLMAREMAEPSPEIDEIVRFCRGSASFRGCPHINPETLKARGFTDEVLAKLEAAIAAL